MGDGPASFARNSQNWRGRSRMAHECERFTPGACLITLSGLTATVSDMASRMSTSATRSGQSKPQAIGTGAYLQPVASICRAVRYCIIAHQTEVAITCGGPGCPSNISVDNTSSTFLPRGGFSCVNQDFRS